MMAKLEHIQIGEVVYDFQDSDTKTFAEDIDAAVTTLNNSVATKISGPDTSTNNAIILFNGTSGKIAKNSGKTIVTSITGSENIPTDAAVKNYVDSMKETVEDDFSELTSVTLPNIYVSKDGDTMVGDLNMEDSAYLNFNGGAITIKDNGAQDGIVFYTEGYEGTSYAGGSINSPVLSFYGTSEDEPVILRGAADPVNSRDAASKNYVDTRIYQGPDAPSDTTMLWIDTDDSTETGGSNSGGTPNALPLAGGTMAGNINMNNNRILGLPTTPSNANEAVSKAYVDSVASGGGGGGIAQAFFTTADGVQPTSNYGLLWIDLSGPSGGLKYYNGSSWVHVPVAYT